MPAGREVFRGAQILKTRRPGTGRTKAGEGGGREPELLGEEKKHQMDGVSNGCVRCTPVAVGCPDLPYHPRLCDSDTTALWQALYHTSSRLVVGL